jgi:hypothetical protein
VKEGLARRNTREPPKVASHRVARCPAARVKRATSLTKPSSPGPARGSGDHRPHAPARRAADARGGTRTPTLLRATTFKVAASTNWATRAWLGSYGPGSSSAPDLPMSTVRTWGARPAYSWIPWIPRTTAATSRGRSACCSSSKGRSARHGCCFPTRLAGRCHCSASASSRRCSGSGCAGAAWTSRRCGSSRPSSRSARCSRRRAASSRARRGRASRSSSSGSRRTPSTSGSARRRSRPCWRSSASSARASRSPTATW